MRRWFFTITAILLVSFSTALYLRSTYLKMDYSDKSNLMDFDVPLLKEDKMFEEYPISKEEYLQVGKSDPYIGKVASETISEDAFLEDPEKEIIIEISWLENWKYELEYAESVALVKSTGKLDNIGGALQQEVEILKVYQGDLFKEKDVVSFVNAIGGFSRNDEGEGYMGISCNLMEKGKQYLVFLTSTPGKLKNLFYGAGMQSNISYFRIDDYEKGYFETEETFIPYSNVKDIEFFCNDEKIYTQLLEVKHDMIKKYVK